MPRDRSVSRIGFIGTGLMGAPMVRRLLLAGFPVTVWNRSPEKSGKLREAGASFAATPAVLASGADVVCLCVTDTSAVEAVVFGDDSVAAGGKDGAILVDFSSISPAATREMARRLRTLAGMEWVDAPVSGGVKGAEAGSLIVLCGGAEEIVERVQPVFAALSHKVTRMGDTGAGQTTKLCNQIIVASNLVAIAEAMVLGKAEGIEIGQLPEALADGWADSLPLQIIGPHIAAGGAGHKIGSLSIMLKDIDTALAFAKQNGIALPVAEQAAEAYRGACNSGLQDGDLSSLGKYFRLGDA